MNIKSLLGKDCDYPAGKQSARAGFEREVAMHHREVIVCINMCRCQTHEMANMHWQSINDYLF